MKLLAIDIWAPWLSSHFTDTWTSCVFLIMIILLVDTLKCFRNDILQTHVRSRRWHHARA